MVKRVERRLAIRVEARMLEAHDADAIAIVGDRVLREVERPAVDAADDLVHVRVGDLVRRAPRRLVDVDDEGLARDLAEHLARQARGLEARGNDAEDAERRRIAHGKARSVRSCAARASPPAPGANGTITGCVSPALENSAMRSRQRASGPTTPSPSRKRGETCFTAPPRSPARQAAFTASTSSAKPAFRKKLA